MISFFDDFVFRQFRGRDDYLVEAAKRVSNRQNNTNDNRLKYIYDLYGIS